MYYNANQSQKLMFKLFGDLEKTGYTAVALHVCSRESELNGKILKVYFVFVHYQCSIELFANEICSASKCERNKEKQGWK